MTTETKEYDVPDPYAVNADTAQDVLSELQSILWYDSQGKLTVDKEWTSETLEKLVTALKPIAPTPRKMVPMRLAVFSVSVMTPVDDGGVSPKKLSELLMLSEMQRQKGMPQDQGYAIHARLDQDSPISEDVTRQMLVKLGYEKDHFDKE